MPRFRPNHFALLKSQLPPKISRHSQLLLPSLGWGGVRQRRSLAFVACGTDGMLSGFAHATDATLTMGWVWGGVGQ